MNALRTVADSDLLARFVVASRHIRSDKTLKPDAFIPHPYPDLSVTLHADRTETELWAVGEKVAEAQKRCLYGRGDIIAEAFRAVALNVVPDPTPTDSNHVIINGWPADKPAQKQHAQSIAKAALFIPVNEKSA